MICHGTFEIVPQEVLWSIWGSHQTLWNLPLPNVAWHSGTWPYTMTPSTDKTLHQFANLLPNWTLLPILTLLPNFGGFIRTLQRVRLANRGRLLLRTAGPVLFGTFICSNVETILSWTCHVYGPFEFRTSLGTSILHEIAMSRGERSVCYFLSRLPNPKLTVHHATFRSHTKAFITSLNRNSLSIMQHGHCCK